MPFSTFDQIMTAATVDKRIQAVQVNKVSAANAVALTGHTLWSGTGYPSAGTTPTVGLGGAVATTKETAGAIPFTNPGGGRKLYLVSSIFQALVGNSCSFMLVDRLAHANITNNQGTGSFSPVIDGTARLASGEGAQILCEVTTAFSASANTRSFTYTNQAGTGSRTSQTMSFVSSSALHRVPFASVMFVGLTQQGDTGVRSIESSTLVTGTATGAFNIALVKPLTSWIPIPIAVAAIQSDYIFEYPILSEIPSDACLQLIVHTTASATYSLVGSIRMVEV